MKILSSVQMDEEFSKKISRESSNYIFNKRLASISDSILSAAEVLVTYGHDVSPELIDKMRNLKWIHIMQSGLNSLPFSKLMEKDILVTNSKGINSVTIAEYTIGMMLNLYRKSFVFYEAQKRKEWDRFTEIDELAGKTLGILGYGSIGKELAKRAKAFDMRILAMKRSSMAKTENVDELILPDNKLRIFEQSDFVVCLLPLTQETYQSVGEEELGRMKKSSYLINVSRGEVIHQQAIVKCLKANKIAGAVLDVFDVEPLPSESELWSLKNVYITPHIAGDRHPTYMSRAVDIFIHNLRSYQDNPTEMMNIVNKKQGY